MSLCGYFDELSLPVANFEAAKEFWEPLGFVATEEADEPYVHSAPHERPSQHRLPPSAHAGSPDAGFQRPRHARAASRALRELDVRFSDELPRGLDAHEKCSPASPQKGTLLLLLKAKADCKNGRVAQA